MPYHNHPSCQPPADEKAIWRYIDLAKFVSMLDDRALFFSQAARLIDPFEGSYPEPNVRTRLEFLSSRGSAMGSRWNALIMGEQWAKEHKKARSLVYVNCWHLNEGESAAMWALYGQRNSSIAIRSTFAHLRDSMASASQDIAIGVVNYKNYALDRMPENHEFDPFLHKRESYAHEQELRALYRWHGNTVSSEADLDIASLPAGFNIACDLDALIDTIVVSPGAPSWFRNVVTSINTRYGIAKEVVKSSLDDGPVY